MIRVHFIFGTADKRTSWDNALITGTSTTTTAEALADWAKLTTPFVLANLQAVAVSDVFPASTGWRAQAEEVRRESLDDLIQIEQFILQHAPLSPVERKHVDMFVYAMRDGYTGSISEYVTGHYNGYVATCQRCGIPPMTRAQWDATR